MPFYLKDSASYEKLVPRLQVSGTCPEGASSYVRLLEGSTYNTITACYCEDHCGWEKCRLYEPPNECLIDRDSIWVWDSQKNYWVAQVVEGIINEIILN